MPAPSRSLSDAGGADGFKRELKLLDATMIVVGSMIGSGIFIVSADIARTVGGAGYLLLVWCIAGLITVVGALSYGELAGMFPRAGGQYLYLRESYNPFTAFLYGWTFFAVIQTGTIAAVAVAFAKFSTILIPSLGGPVFQIGSFRVSGAQLYAISSILLLTFVSTKGIRGGKILQDVFSVAKLLALMGVILVGVLFGSNSHAISSNMATCWDATWTHVSNGRIVGIESLTGFGVIAALGAAMVGALFSSDAWNNITFTAAEVVEPRKTIPLSLVMGTGIVIILYLLANMAYVLVLPVQGSPDALDVAGRGIQFATEDRVGTAAASVLFGDTATLIMAALIMVSTFGCNNGLILAGARVYYAMAVDGLFFKSAGTLNRNAVPAVALWVQAVWASVLCLSGTYGDLLDYVVFAVLIFYILTVWGIVILRRTRPGAERPYRVWGYPLLPVLYIVAAAAIAIDLLIFKPAYTIPGVGIVLLGIPVYYIWRQVGER
jgi:basic amino acid/polyamine antiporter, APA family